MLFVEMIRGVGNGPVLLLIFTRRREWASVCLLVFLGVGNGPVLCLLSITRHREWASVLFVNFHEA